MADLFTTTASNWSYGYTPPSNEDFDTYGMPDIVNVAENFIEELARVLFFLKKQNDYERSEVNRTDCLGMFGADDIASHVKAYGITAYDMSYPRYPESAMNSYNRQRVPAYYYRCWLTLAQYFYGYDLPASRYPFTLCSESGTVTNYTQIAMNDYSKIGINFGSFWRHPRSTGGEYADSGRNGIMSNNPNCVFCGDTAWKSSFQSNREKAVYDFISVITYMVKIDHLRTELADCLPTEQGGNGEEADYYDPRYSDMFFTERATQLFKLLPNPICQVRQALAKVMLDPKYGTEEWQPWTYAGQVQVSIAVQNALNERGLLNGLIPDMTVDPGNSSIYYSPVNDPLLTTGTGYGLIADPDGDLSHLAPIVILRRQYMFKPYYYYYDYPEANNPNAFEKQYGRVNYGQSNARTYLTTPAQSNGQWAKPQHDYDVFLSTSSSVYAYLRYISVLLRSNLAKTEMLYPIGNASHIANNTCAVGIVRDWVGLPTMTQLGYTNAVSTRKTARVAVDGQVHGEYYFMGEYGEIEYGSNSFCAEDNWRTAMTSHTYNKIGYNPNFKTTVDTTTKKVPTRTPANYASDSYDATISNRVACMNTAANGSTAMTNTTTQPYFAWDGYMVYFSLAAFHADKIDPSLPSTSIHGAELES